MKKKIQAIWQAGLEDFATRRDHVASQRAAMTHEAAREAARGAMHEADAVHAGATGRALGRATEQQLQRAIVAATAPLRQEVDALRRELDALRLEVDSMKQASTGSEPAAQGAPGTSAGKGR
jgi:polyhydroxyalkanoate synthesis regulator phasin